MPSGTEKVEDQSGGHLVCPSCNGHNHPQSRYCAHCSAPLGSTAAWDIQAAGYVLREASATNRPKPVLLIGVWLLFFPMWIGCLSMFYLIGMLILEGQHGYILSLLVALFFWILASAILYRSTTNYFQKKSQEKNTIINANCLD
jgi:hypothetical protein